jgi:signal transduction histidine kinase
MRRLLGLLRTGEPGAGEQDAGQYGPAAAEAGAYAPPLGLADVDDLAERLRGAGLPVTILRQGEPRDMPEDVELTVYRIVQEALTNVLKHAGPAEATVRLEFSEPVSSIEPGRGETGCGEYLELTVTDDGRGAAAGLDGPAAPGAGRGTAGMRERVAALGGTLTAGPRPGGGFRVHARIPL